jgi:hypothetical protein
MTRLATAAIAILALSASFAGTAQAESPYAAWGTGGSASRGSAGLSNQLHQTERDLAQAAELARHAANNLSGSACGSCIYYSIQGNNNVISGNSTTLTNAGDVQGTAEFNFD